MKQTHTPGPWRVTPKGNETFIDSDGGLICDIKRNARLDCQETYQCDANARLISAAPDLLDALRDCVESLGRLPDTDKAYRVTCIQQAREAIKKATGQ